MRNRDMKFICRPVYLKVNNNSAKFTKNYQKDEIIKIPIANMDGNYFANDDILKELQDNNNIAFTSYPGCISSPDSFYILQSGLLVTDTSLELLNPGLFDDLRTSFFDVLPFSFK